jgi:hypothetical protein
MPGQRYKINQEFKMVRTKKSFVAAVMACIGLLGSSAALADPQWCTWKVSTVWTNDGGSVLALFKERGDHLAVCSLKGDFKGIPKETCKAWNQYLTVAVVTGKSVIVQYNNAPVCSQIPSYGNAPAPAYVMLLGS